MAKAKGQGTIGSMKGHVRNNKKTSIGCDNIKRSSMNKSKKASYKKYRGQGK
jgi:hypothetical protein